VHSPGERPNAGMGEPHDERREFGAQLLLAVE
jgi:hypothetical protein